MIYQQMLPPPALAHYVRYFWTLDDPAGPVKQHTFGPLADGCPGLIFQPAAQGRFYDQHYKPLPELFVYGQSVQQTSLLFCGQFRVTGACLWPHTLKAITGLDACELTDACLDLTTPAPELLEGLLASEPIDQLMGHLTRYLLNQIQHHSYPLSRATGHVISQLMQTGGSHSLMAIRTHLGLSERSVERLFQQQVGVSPKRFATICRFQDSLDHLTRSNSTPLIDVAYSNGYADQAHFNRCFKALVGQTPTQFRQLAASRVIPFGRVLH